MALLLVYGIYARGGLVVGHPLNHPMWHREACKYREGVEDYRQPASRDLVVWE